MINDSESVSLLLLTLFVFVDKHAKDDDYYNSDDVKPIHTILKLRNYSTTTFLPW